MIGELRLCVWRLEVLSRRFEKALDVLLRHLADLQASLAFDESPGFWIVSKIHNPGEHPSSQRAACKRQKRVLGVDVRVIPTEELFLRVNQRLGEKALPDAGHYLFRAFLRGLDCQTFQLSANRRDDDVPGRVLSQIGGKPLCGAPEKSLGRGLGQQGGHPFCCGTARREHHFGPRLDGGHTQ